MQKYERDLHRKARYTNHHIFSLRCRDEGVIPVSLRIKPPVKTKRRYEIGEPSSLKTYRRYSGRNVRLLPGLILRDARWKVTKRRKTFSALIRCVGRLQRRRLIGPRRTISGSWGSWPGKWPSTWDTRDWTDAWLIIPRERCCCSGNGNNKVGKGWRVRSQNKGQWDYQKSQDTTAQPIEKAENGTEGVEEHGMMGNPTGRQGNATVLMEREQKIKGLLNTGTYRLLRKDPTATQETSVERTLLGVVRRNEISK